MSKQSLLVAFFWLCLASLIYYLADSIQNPNKLEKLGAGNSVMLKRGLDGHYRSEALINGEKFNVLVDTGATGVTISQTAADKLNLKSNDAIQTITANGSSVGYMVRLDAIQLGGVRAKNVSAMIAPGLEGDVLLGMSFLSRMDVRLYRGEMAIKQISE